MFYWLWLDVSCAPSTYTAIVLNQWVNSINWQFENSHRPMLIFPSYHSYALLKRGEIRERYNIQGSGCSDCCVSFWCSCCAVIQQDNEVKIRQQNAAAAGPVQQGYQPQPGMQMPPTPAATYQQPAEK